MSTALIIFDVEATCDINLPKQKRELIEIGAVKIRDNVVIDTFSELVKPKKNSTLSNYCKNLTHISQEDINLADEPVNVLMRFIEWSKDCVLGSWGEFDADIIKKELHKNKVNLINDLHFINIKKLYLSVKHFPNTYSLQDSLKKEKIKFSGTQHRAYDDAYNTYLIYQKNKARIDEMIKLLYSSKCSIT
jgi:inhibitor of KinA sporulation pathway (predicted exonuclease)